jgi:hypothetical protein
MFRAIGAGAAMREDDRRRGVGGGGQPCHPGKKEGGETDVAWHDILLPGYGASRRLARALTIGSPQNRDRSIKAL